MTVPRRPGSAYRPYDPSLLVKAVALPLVVAVALLIGLVVLLERIGPKRNR